MGIRELIPKDKYDMANIAALKAMNNQPFAPIAHDVLAWHQDMNRPVFYHEG